MKLLSRPNTLADVCWFLAISAGLWILYLLFHRLGFSSNVSKGLSLLALLILIGIGLIAQRQWIKSRWSRRFKELSLQQQILELDKVFEEQVSAGVITRMELDEIGAKAKAKFEREGFDGRVGDKSV